MEPTNNKSMQYIILIKNVLKYMHMVQNSYSNGFHKDKTFKHIQQYLILYDFNLNLFGFELLFHNTVQYSFCHCFSFLKL